MANYDESFYERTIREGKTAQRRLFVTLDRGSDGQVLNTFHRDLPSLEAFGHYEGANQISGDAMLFFQLDNDGTPDHVSPWWGVLIGDVSGKGIESGFVMGVLSAAVISYFKNWKRATGWNSFDLDKLLVRLNDMIEPILTDSGRGLFMAAEIGLFNCLTGEYRFSPAGYNRSIVWRAGPEVLESVGLERTISLGAMPTFLHSPPYHRNFLKVDLGDVVIRLTDGIEESMSLFRDGNWQPVAYFDPSDISTICVPGERKEVHPEGTPPGVLRTVQSVSADMFGFVRLQEIVTAYFQKGVYELKKTTPEGVFTVFQFDFSSRDWSAKGIVLAIISVERMFRLVPDPRLAETDRVRLSRVDDEFLRRHLVGYDRYFRNGLPDYVPGFSHEGDLCDAQGFRLVAGQRVVRDEEYIWYPKLAEDPQSDITVMAFRRK